LITSREARVDIQGTAAIVTGGASGLGAATARRLADAGAEVTIIDVQDDLGTRVAAEIGGTYAHADVTSEDEVTAAVEHAASRRQLRSVVNCAGIAMPARTIGRDGRYSSAYSLDDFARIVAINLTGTFNCTRLAATAMSRLSPDAHGERGAVVNTASVAAYEGPVGQVAYAASKAGIAGMTLPLARDLAPAGIRVNAVAPGLFDTPLYDAAADADAVKATLGAHAVFPRRFGGPDEFASLVYELLTNSFMNGEVVRIDGAVRMPPK
jgi:NAD(P)-dependent dehydrogenase (short-subunit alcohol dehydrogenase family)